MGGGSKDTSKGSQDGPLASRKILNGTTSRSRPCITRLQRVILPLYYSDPKAYAGVMRSTIAINGSFFNTQRMLSQYVSNAYYPRTNASVETSRESAKLMTGVKSNS
jgi:hypothetical protein